MQNLDCCDVILLNEHIKFHFKFWVLEKEHDLYLQLSSRIFLQLNSLTDCKT